MTDLEKAMAAGATEIADDGPPIEDAVDLGPSGRRVAAKLPPRPREQDDQALGIDSPMQSPHPETFNFDKFRGKFGGAIGRDRPGNSAMAGDPLAQMITTGMVLGPLGNAVRALHPVMGTTIPGAAIGAAEGVGGAKAMGAENSQLGMPAVLGGLFGAVGPFGRAVQQSKGGLARAFLDEQGVPPTAPKPGFGAPSEGETMFDPQKPVAGMGDIDGMPSGQAVAALEKYQASLGARDPVIDQQIARIKESATSTVNPRLPEVDAAQRTLEFSPPNRGDMMHGGMAGLAAHALHLPPSVQALLAIASAGARNLPAIEGRILSPMLSGADAPAWAAPTFGAATGER